jgi:hypothetical protein
MAVPAEDVVNKIIQQMVGVHFTKEQAARLKQFIDLATELNPAACPCSKCRKS